MATHKLSTLRNEVRTYIAAAKEHDRKLRSANGDVKRSNTALGKLRELLSELEEEVCEAEGALLDELDGDDDFEF